jgi:phosphate transport system protein
MPIYEERLANDLKSMREKIAVVGRWVDESLEKAVKAVLEGNHDLANDVILGDYAINRGFKDIDHLCHNFLAVHLPTAGHLRFVSSILKLNAELERIGDHATTIAREALQLSASPGNSFRATIVAMAGDSQEMLRRAIKAFNTNDVDLARETIGISTRVMKEFDKVFRNLGSDDAVKSGSMHDLLVLSVVFSKLERISARAENICEEAMFAITGEEPAAKKTSILFIDETNGGLSRLAEAVGRKTASKTCSFTSMGRVAGAGLHNGLKSFLDTHGLDAGVAPPRALPQTLQEIAGYDLIISLEGPVRSYIPEQPFHTVFLQWDVGALPGDVEKSQQVERYYALYHELTTRLRDLVDALNGKRGA